ncbi:hypothetical protein BAUCODRAFT_126511 [Baudoinia panamericana UAMH 10762]|uniref:Uncharacterized protein n=1 Tax=Baudoinia panamericana (strain UAMH 10762) TaxID=717646 RepID=M2MME6_BAUPA|nr:uncharacterized protein BAUCODRAFT_126511 [Baudoinia panamericana UAMH 10762]EMC92543.1 hypothetical protein BAUCODRAFT_126511 [Baudoinia panamericana UAMH 10762]
MIEASRRTRVGCSRERRRRIPSTTLQLSCIPSPCSICLGDEFSLAVPLPTSRCDDFSSAYTTTLCDHYPSAPFPTPPSESMSESRRRIITGPPSRPIRFRNSPRPGIANTIPTLGRSSFSHHSMTSLRTLLDSDRTNRRRRPTSCYACLRCLIVSLNLTMSIFSGELPGVLSLALARRPIINTSFSIAQTKSVRITPTASPLCLPGGG